MDLHEANKKLQAAGQQKPGEDMSAIKKQLEDQRKHIEDQSRQVDEQRKNVDSKFKQINERERALQELDKQLQRRKDQIDHLEASLKKVFKYNHLFNSHTNKCFTWILGWRERRRCRRAQ